MICNYRPISQHYDTKREENFGKKNSYFIYETIKLFNMIKTINIIKNNTIKNIIKYYRNKIY